MQATTTRPRITATADGERVVSHAGSRLLADVADRTTPTGQLGAVLAGLRKPRARHGPGRVLVDMAVAVADGATTIFDIAELTLVTRNVKHFARVPGLVVENWIDET